MDVRDEQQQQQQQDDDNSLVLKDHVESHEETLRVLKEAVKSAGDAKHAATRAYERLKEATRKYEERLHGPTASSGH